MVSSIRANVAEALQAVQVLRATGGTETVTVITVLIDSLRLSARAVLWTQAGIAVALIVIGAVEGLINHA